jgi:intein/homing endonuclease
VGSNPIGSIFYYIHWSSADILYKQPINFDHLLFIKMIKNKEKLLKNPILARIAADITGDGHLQIQDHRYMASFFSKHFEEINTINRRFYDLFNIKGIIYIDNSKSKLCKNNSKRYKIFFISKGVALFLRDIGVPVGNKTNNRFEIPKFVLNGNRKLKSAYLRGLFDNEGTIFCRKNYKDKMRW